MPDRYDDDDPPDGEDEEEMTPEDPDWDLSEEHGYTWEPDRPNWPVPPWLLVTITVLVVLALVLPTVLIIVNYD